MKFIPLPLEGLLLFELTKFSDERGYFFESYNKALIEATGLNINFVQDNESCSLKNVLRGLHFQVAPYEQGKLVRVVKGAALDIMVDIRKNSKSYGAHHKVLLKADKAAMLWIPPGFAHGFLSLEEDTIFLYKCTGYYNKASERGIKWNDPQLNINWGINDPVVSEKDNALPLFKQL